MKLGKAMEGAFAAGYCSDDNEDNEGDPFDSGPVNPEKEPDLYPPDPNPNHTWLHLKHLIYLLVVSMFLISLTLGDMGIYMTDFDRESGEEVSRNAADKTLQVCYTPEDAAENIQDNLLYLILASLLEDLEKSL
ncbi:hypothetical protein DUI87_13305 [Hirundo rustica rustica]|uniref:Uncharacterized protein n=1 Tax=Hirundo rustica rustica TaxID=333673 RepID=A0A3M0KHP7_HIRRU|nr:hypothetical protein DUI87_13305 [Hirundo rustica rustica]